VYSVSASIPAFTIAPYAFSDYAAGDIVVDSDRHAVRDKT